MSADPDSMSRRDEDVQHARVVGGVARRSGLNLAGTAVAAVLMFLQSVVVARGVSTVEAGVFFSVTSAAVILTTIAVFGADVSLPRFVPLLRSRGQTAAAESTVRMASRTAVAVSLALALPLLLAPDAVSHLLGLPARYPHATVILVLLVACLPFSAVATVWVSATRAYMSIRPTVVLEKVGKASLQIASMLAAIALGASAAGLVGAWLIPTAVLAVPALLWLRRIAARSRPPVVAPVEGERGPGLRREYFQYTWPRALQSILQIILQRLDVIIVASAVSAEQAAIYALASRFIVLGQFAQQALQQVVAPHLSQMFAEDRSGSALRLAQAVTTWSILLVWPVYLVGIWGGTSLLTILGGAEYAAGAATLAILACGMLFASATGPVDTVLLMAGRSSLSLSITVVALVVDLSLLMVLLPPLGIEGAAIAHSVAVVVRTGLSLAIAKRVTGLTTLSREVAWAAGATVSVFLVVPLVVGRIGGGGVWLEVGALVLCAVLYIPLVWLLRRRLALPWPRRHGATG